MAKALSLWQPWASAIALGLKQVETRHWSTKYRGLLVIHAAKRWTREQQGFASAEYTLGRLPFRLPLGAIVATAQLIDVLPVEEMVNIPPLERLYGNYAAGRYGWVLEDVQAFEDPIACPGRQGLFNVSEEVLRHGKIL